jgi:hypothetical protein
MLPAASWMNSLVLIWLVDALKLAEKGQPLPPLPAGSLLRHRQLNC